MEMATSFGHWLKQQRKALDLTQAELAAAVGCAMMTIQKIEAEERRPSKDLAAHLARVLRVSPSDHATFMRVARGALPAERLSDLAGLPAAPPPRMAPARLPTLPVPRTPLIGREQELAQLRAMVLHDEIGLVTLTGPGGTGKTRLAIAVAAQLADAFPDGVQFVALGPLIDPALVPSTVATALGVSQQGQRSLDERLIAYLAPKRLLLVLDNFEHLLPASAWVADLLQRCPALTVLVTSRAVLHLSAEHEFAVPPLTLPEMVERGGRLQVPPLHQVRQSDAVRLFETRTQAIRPDFVLDETTAPAVAAICRQLDGLPLALELAAARSRLLAPAALLGRLEHRLDVLTGGARDVPIRQRTLRATIDWSYALLTAEEQHVFARCAVFAGSFGLDAVDAVCAGPGLTTPVLDLLQALVEQGLLQSNRLAARPPAALPDVGPRFTMLETIREYALERLGADGALDEVRRRHTAYMLEVAETAEPALLGRDDVAWLLWLNRERDNFRAALRWSASAPDGADFSLRLGTALWRYWDIWDAREGQDWLERELERQRPVPPAVRAKALGRAAEFAARQKVDLTHARARAEESLQACRTLNDARGSGFALHVLGLVAIYQHDLATAHTHWSASLEWFCSVEDGWGQGQALFWLANIAHVQQALQQARGLWTDALAQFARSGDTPARAHTLGNLGLLAAAQGDMEQATRWYRQAVREFVKLFALPGVNSVYADAGTFARLAGDLAGAQEYAELGLRVGREYGDAAQMANALITLAEVAEDQGDGAEAGRRWQEGLAWSRQVGEAYRTVATLIGVGASANTQGDHRQAQACFREALALLPHERDAAPMAVRSVVGMAWAAAGLGQVERAAYLGGAADASMPRSGLLFSTDWDADQRPRHERSLASLRSTIEQAGLTAMWEVGTALTLEQAIAYALDDQNGNATPGTNTAEAASDAERSSR